MEEVKYYTYNELFDNFFTLDKCKKTTPYGIWEEINDYLGYIEGLLDFLFTQGAIKKLSKTYHYFETTEREYKEIVVPFVSAGLDVSSKIKKI